MSKLGATTAFIYVGPLLLAAACSGSNVDSSSDSGADSGTTTAAQDATWENVRPIIESRCARCHSADRLSTYRRLETHRDVTALRTNIVDKLKTPPPRGLRMPVASNHTNDAGCTPEHPQLNDKTLTDDEIDLVVEFLNRTDHLDYVDEFDPITAPAVPLLTNAVTYTSSEFDVLNDGFIEPPDGDSDGYMEEFDYDQREYDQMEDDWFCIAFDPNLTDVGYLTGMQVLTESGQIYLNSQLVVDTTGGSAAAKAAADEKGADWYRCDPGLGFSDAIPLWRTVPGGGAVELPDETGFRIEPGWTFVLRADFHTHFDAEEFERLNQDGVIDRDAGTMTWHNQASLLVQWADAADVSRELKWMSVSPSTPEERQGFAVPPGESTLTYSAPVTASAKQTIFSAEVSMGKNGHVASLRSADSCIANNSDFSPKWIEQAIYAEADAPQIEPNGALTLDCTYDNSSTQTVAWGAESEATVWGRKERCQAVVFHYNTSE